MLGRNQALTWGIPPHHNGLQYIWRSSQDWIPTTLGPIPGALCENKIDGGFGIWLPPADFPTKQSDVKWLDFQANVNGNHGLEWEIHRPLNLSPIPGPVSKDCARWKHSNHPLQKLMTLHLFFPPHSMHPPEMLNRITASGPYMHHFSWTSFIAVYQICQEKKTVSYSV